MVGLAMAPHGAWCATLTQVGARSGRWAWVQPQAGNALEDGKLGRNERASEARVGEAGRRTESGHMSGYNLIVELFNAVSPRRA